MDTRASTSAETAAAALQARVRTRARVLRDGRAVNVPTEEVVPGDVVLLSAGSLVPADGVDPRGADFFVSEAVLTGESFPVEKRPGTVAATAGLRDRLNCVFLGTNVAKRHRALPDRRPLACGPSLAPSLTA